MTAQTASIKTPVKKGDHSADVGRIQAVLLKMKLLPERNLNGTASVDCEFGPSTEEAVKKFQKEAGYPETGVVDQDTLGALIPYRTIVISGFVSTELKLEMPRLRLLPARSGVGPIVPPLTLDPHAGDQSAGSPVFREPKIFPIVVNPNGAAAGSQSNGSTANKAGSGAGVVIQPQFGPQYLGKPVWYAGPHNSPAPGRSMTYPFNFWATYRTAKDGRHWEFGLGPGFSINHKYEATDPRYTLSANASISLADIWAPGSFHLISPNLQFGVYDNTNKSLANDSYGLSANIVNQMSYEIISDRIIVAVTPGFWISYDFKSRETALAPGIAGWIGGSF